jgi:hypothetical protein
MRDTVRHSVRGFIERSRAEPEPAALPLRGGWGNVPLVVRDLPPGIAYLALDRHEDAPPPTPWPSAPPAHYLNQLHPAWQARMAARYAEVDPATCHWYHEVELADGRRIAGGWDLIGGEPDYLGDVDFRDLRVLELGPATGHLTFWMEREGAEVVAFEAGFDVSIDLIPYGADELFHSQRDAMAFVERVHSSWWWLHRHYRSTARIARGSIYALPRDLGMFDVATFGSILLHLQNPYGALEAASRLTRRAIVVTDVVPTDLADPFEPHVRFNPVPGDRSSWWLLAPGAVQRMLTTLGFGRQRIGRHVQYLRPGHDPAADPQPVELYTVVAERT